MFSAMAPALMKGCINQQLMDACFQSALAAPEKKTLPDPGPSVPELEQILKSVS